jgi:hypothetical protein
MNINLQHRLLLYARGLYRKMIKPTFSDGEFSTSVLSGQQGNDQIAQLIKSGNPVMIARFGYGELAAIMNYVAINHNRTANGATKLFSSLFSPYPSFWDPNVFFGLCETPGFFPAEQKYIEQYGALHLDLIRDIDYLGSWDNYGEKYLNRTYFPKAIISTLDSIEPYYWENPWSQYLAGKTVLVVHPFTKSIGNNYRQRKQLFSSNVLPEFELKTLKSVQTITGNRSTFNNWFEALDHMKEQISRETFDVCIIGCGAYGMPLAAFIKNLGKQAVHMGGATQILFGIKGKRWESQERVAMLFNQYWTRPLPEEIVPNAAQIENGAYW